MRDNESDGLRLCLAHSLRPHDASFPTMEQLVGDLVNQHREDVFKRLRFRWKADNYLVRALVKLKKTDEALREVERLLKNKRGNQLLLVYASAAHGGPKAALAAIDKHRPARFAIDSYYQDPDLGPLLRGKAFQTFRDRFPEPKQNP